MTEIYYSQLLTNNASDNTASAHAFKLNAENNWENISRDVNVANPNNIHGRIDTASLSAGSQNPLDSKFPSTEQLLESFAAPNIDTDKLRQDWAKNEINGQPLNPGEHKKGFEVQAGTSTTLHKRDQTAPIASVPSDSPNGFEYNNGGTVEVPAATSTNPAKRDQFETRPVSPDQPTGFEWAPGEGPQTEITPSDKPTTKQ